MDRLTELRVAIADNTVPGGSAYGRAAAEVIALTLEANRVTGEELVTLLGDTSSWLVQTKPSMTSIRTVTALAAETIKANPSTDAVVSAMRAYIAESEASIARVAQHADTVIKSGSKVLFHSYSGSLIQILTRAAQSATDLTFMLTESRPYRESLRVVTALQELPVEFVAYSDASMTMAAADADLVIVGADALFRDGSFANKIGSLPLALSCRYVDTPYYVVTELTKLYRGDPEDVAMEQRPPMEMAREWELWTSGRLTVRNQFFERVPAELVTAYLTDEGLLTPEDLVHRSTTGS